MTAVDIASIIAPVKASLLGHLFVLTKPPLRQRSWLLCSSSKAYFGQFLGQIRVSHEIKTIFGERLLFGFLAQ